LDADRLRATKLFVRERMEDGTRAYREAFDRTLPLVERLFTVSRDLADFGDDLLHREPGVLHAARYLAAPPISADDLVTLVGRSPGRRVDADLSRVLAGVLRASWDPVRFPWLCRRRSPTQQERDAAVNWTASIWAIEQLRTARRTQASRRQQGAVERLLLEAGFTLEASLRTVGSLDDLPRGHFARECQIAGTKCDVPIRLRDGRLLALECKVSNSALNSVKRLLRETGGKARQWAAAYGEQIVTGAVLAGVFKLHNLVDAQETYKVSIFWEHDLTPLVDFLSAAA